MYDVMITKIKCALVYAYTVFRQLSLMCFNNKEM